MNDDDLTGLLRRYRPPGPPTSLRTRALTPPVAPRRAWPWLVAAGVLLALTIGAQTASVRTRNKLARLVSPVETDSEVNALEEALGGGPDARATAERMLLERAFDRAREDAERPVGTAGTTP
jgi:hypothetical protein